MESSLFPWADGKEGLSCIPTSENNSKRVFVRLDVTQATGALESTSQIPCIMEQDRKRHKSAYIFFLCIRVEQIYIQYIYF